MDSSGRSERSPARVPKRYRNPEPLGRAEGEGFEPSRRLTTSSGFRDRYEQGDLQVFLSSCASMFASWDISLRPSSQLRRRSRMSSGEVGRRPARRVQGRGARARRRLVYSSAGLVRTSATWPPRRRDPSGGRGHGRNHSRSRARGSPAGRSRRRSRCPGTSPTRRRARRASARAPDPEPEWPERE